MPHKAIESLTTTEKKFSEQPLVHPDFVRGVALCALGISICSQGFSPGCFLVSEEGHTSHISEELASVDAYPG